MKKFMMALSLTLALAGLAGCGSDGGGSATDTTPQQQSALVMFLTSSPVIYSVSRAGYAANTFAATSGLWQTSPVITTGTPVVSSDQGSWSVASDNKTLVLVPNLGNPLGAVSGMQFLALNNIDPDGTSATFTPGIRLYTSLAAAQDYYALLTSPAVK